MAHQKFQSAWNLCRWNWSYSTFVWTLDFSVCQHCRTSPTSSLNSEIFNWSCRTRVRTSCSLSSACSSSRQTGRVASCGPQLFLELPRCRRGLSDVACSALCARLAFCRRFERSSSDSWWSSCPWDGPWVFCQMYRSGEGLCRPRHWTSVSTHQAFESWSCWSCRPSW